MLTSRAMLRIAIVFIVASTVPSPARADFSEFLNRLLPKALRFAPVAAKREYRGICWPLLRSLKPSRAQSLEIRFERFDDARKTEARAEVEVVLASVNAVLKGTIEIPDELKLLLFGEYAYARFDFEETGAIMLTHGIYSNTHRDYWLSILIHEYGHALFSHGLRKSSTEFGRIMRILDQVRDLYWKKINPGIEVYVNENDEVKQEAILSKIRPYKAKALELERGLPAKSVRNRRLPYEEVWSDLLQVVFSKNPQVAAEEDGSRDFEKVWSKRMIDRWSPNDNHTKLDPVRSAIYQKYGSALLSDGPERGLALAKIFQVLQKEAASRFDDPSLHDMDVPTMNHRLIRALNE